MIIIAKIHVVEEESSTFLVTIFTHTCVAFSPTVFNHEIAIYDGYVGTSLNTRRFISTYLKVREADSTCRDCATLVLLARRTSRKGGMPLLITTPLSPYGKIY